MAIDFNKIFAQNGQKVELTDEQYLTGWGYLGSGATGQAPSYQTFNYYMNQVDQKFKLLKDTNGDGIPIGAVMPFLSKNIQAGWLDISTGALVSRATYPDLWAWVQANAPLITESAWQAQSVSQTSVGAYSSGDGSTTFRLPRIIDYVRGGLQADVGKWQGDTIRNITGSGMKMFGCAPTGPMYAASSSAETAGSGASTGSAFVNFDVSRVVPTADENRPKTIKMIYCIKAFGASTNQGMIDITALANSLNSKLDKVDVGMAIIYPNGGSEGSPANVSINSRYENVIPAGFEGHELLCKAELFYNGKWGETGIYNAPENGAGVASHHFNGKIVTQTGLNYLLIASSYMLNPFNIPNVTITTPTPCRVKVYKLARVVV